MEGIINSSEEFFVNIEEELLNDIICQENLPSSDKVEDFKIDLAKKKSDPDEDDDYDDEDDFDDDDDFEDEDDLEDEEAIDEDDLKEEPTEEEDFYEEDFDLEGDDNF